ncbi:MAG: peptidylprolyl isomerase [Terriglobales bacterium]
MRTSLPHPVLAAAAALACALALAAQKPAPKLPLSPGTYAVFATSKGSFTAQLYPQAAPKGVANFIGLARGTQPWRNPLMGMLSSAPLYHNLLFFRTVPGFMIQTGDPLNNGTGSIGYTLPLETNHLKFDRPGRMALAQVGGDTSSRGPQIFFTLAAVPTLDKEGFLIIGQVVEGLDVVKAISLGPHKPGTEDQPQYPVILRDVHIQVVK